MAAERRHVAALVRLPLWRRRTGEETHEALLGLVARSEGATSPNFSRLLLERPELARAYPLHELLALLLGPDAPTALLQQLGSHRDAALAEAARRHLALAVMPSPWADPHASGMLWKRDLQRIRSRLVELIALGPLPGWYAPVLIVHGDAEVRRALIRYRRVPTALRRTLADAGADAAWRGYATPAAQVDPALLTALRHGSDWAQGLVARHPLAPEETLAALLSSSLVTVRQALAGNPALPRSMRSTLVSDPSPRVRQAVASTPRVARADLALLAADQSASVRVAVATNPRTAQADLRQLARDPADAVRFALARRPLGEPGQLSLLAADPSWPVRRFVARHPETPVSVLEGLAFDAERSVRYEAARNPRLPAATVQRLRSDPDPVLRHLAARRGGDLLP